MGGSQGHLSVLRPTRLAGKALAGPVAVSWDGPLQRSVCKAVQQLQHAVAHHEGAAAACPAGGAGEGVLVVLEGLLRPPAAAAGGGAGGRCSHGCLHQVRAPVTRALVCSCMACGKPWWPVWGTPQIEFLIALGAWTCRSRTCGQPSYAPALEWKIPSHQLHDV
jgi:hypothetical protein